MMAKQSQNKAGKMFGQDLINRGRAIWRFWSLLIVISCLVLPRIALAEDVDPWMDPEVIKASMAISMTREERLQFRDHLSEFLQGYGGDVRKLLRKHNQTNLPRKIAKKRNVRVETMDAQMLALLSEERYPGYETYRDKLLEKMDERQRDRRR